MAQVVFQFQPLHRFAVHGFIVELHVVAAEVFGVVHGHVGVFQQFNHTVAIVGIDGNTNTGADKDFTLVKEVGLV